MRASQNPHHICQIARELILQKGFDNVSMADIARAAAVDEAGLYTLFGTRQDIILFLYQSINADWQLYVREMPPGPLADRFEQAMHRKATLLAPYAQLMGHISGLLMQDARIGIQSARTSHIRAIGSQCMDTIIAGATDSKALKQKVDGLPGILYVLHWGILFFSIHNGDRERNAETIRLAGKLLRQAGNIAPLLRLFPFFNDVGNWADGLLAKPEANDFSLEHELLKIIFNHRKTTPADEACRQTPCETCLQLNESQIRYFTSLQQPLHFILPAFPAKSPNQNKVLGELPDLGEEIALNTLEDLCREIGSVYPPGAIITICSDGRIFSELVGVTDEQVTRYVDRIKQMIDRLELTQIRIVNLEDLIGGGSFNELRERVLAAYAEPLTELQERLNSNAEFRSLFNGMHRFITEDRKALYPQLSVSKVKAESATIALEVIRHSNAWTRFLTYVYPDAIRLSIHPYPAHSDKIGIRLTKAADNWITPWHGVIVLAEDGYTLMKRSEAEAAGARMMSRDGQPYYYTLIPE